MIRALSLTCLALVLVGLGGSAAFAGKPSIAVLGLEVIDQNGTPSAADIQAAKELSDGLRARAKAGTGPYQLAPGSDKELIDQKLLNNCDEGASCMSSIGKQLDADVLMFGHFEKQGKAYQVTIKMLDVGRKAVLKSSSDMIPLSEASGAPLQGWAKRIYGKLTGESVGTVVVKLSNADRGTILVEGEQRGTITNGTGTVSGLPEGKAIRIGVESEGFPRWEKDVTIGSSGTTTVTVDLEAGGEIIGPGPGPGPGPGHGPEGGKRLGWKIGIGVGALVTVGGLYFAYSSWNKASDVKSEQCMHGNRPAGENCVATLPPLSMDQVKDLDAKGDKYATRATIGWGIAGAGAVIAGISVYKVLTSTSSSSESQASRGRRVRKDRTFIVTPVVSSNGGGATLRVDW